MTDWRVQENGRVEVLCPNGHWNDGMIRVSGSARISGNRMTLPACPACGERPFLDGTEVITAR